MKITESRLRKLIRQVIKESTDMPGDPYHDARMSAAAAAEVGDANRDMSGMDPPDFDKTAADSWEESYDEFGLPHDDADGFAHAVYGSDGDDFDPDDFDPDLDTDLDPVDPDLDPNNFNY